MKGKEQKINMTIAEAVVESGNKLKEFTKLSGRKGICVDYDETLISSKKAPELTSSIAVALILNVAKSEIVPLIATARGVTMERAFTQEFRQEESQGGDKGLVVYIAGADGRSLAKFVDGEKVETLYEHALTEDQIEAARRAYQEAKSITGTPDSNSIKTFQSFLSGKWDPALLSQEYIDLAKEFDGIIFVEPTKFSIAGPDDPERYPDMVTFLNDHVKNAGLSASWGRRDRFIHIRPAFDEDGKLKALQTVAEREGIQLDHFASFGDAPLGNDKGILTGVPYGFTNAEDFLLNHENGVSPYIITHPASPVHAVHAAITTICHSS